MRLGPIIAAGLIVAFVATLALDFRKLWRNLSRHKKQAKNS